MVNNHEAGGGKPRWEIATCRVFPAAMQGGSTRQNKPALHHCGEIMQGLDDERLI
jgi:hypothetical protein